MVKKQFIAYLLLGIISLQLLPFREVGRLLYSNQMVEEIHQAIDVDGKNTEGNEDLKKNEIYFSRSYLNIPCNNNIPLNRNIFGKSYVSRLADDAPPRPPIPSCS